MLKPILHAHNSGIPRMQGSILLESMVSILLLSLGIIVLSGSLVSSLNLSNSSLLRSKVSILGNEMADRIRANMQGQATGNYNNLTNYATATTASCTSGVCTPTQMALNDYYDWNQHLQSELPSGMGAVCLTSTDSGSTPVTELPTAPQCDGIGSTLYIKIWWVEKNKTYMFSQLVRP